MGLRAWRFITLLLAALVDRVMTFVYFIQTMLKLMANETLPKSEPVATAV